ncbi:MAG: glycosyltransferase [Pontiella sp.]
MKILHVGYSAYGGGGGAAMRRLNEALCARGADSRFLYLHPHVSALSPLSFLGKKLNGVQNLIIRWLIGRGRSLNLFPTRVLKAINKSDADVVHLHWIHGEMLSVHQISRIEKPLVWTFHDMWPFCGSYHCEEQELYAGGYTSGLEGWMFRRKKRSWNGLAVEIISPSRWMAQCVNDSDLFGSYPVEVISNTLDLECFKPSNKKMARKELGLPQNKKLVLSGANSDHPLKGRMLLRQAVSGMSAEGVELVVFGAGGREGYDLLLHDMGWISDERKLSLLYAAADVVCIPSRMESFGFVAAEAIACGVPVVAFDIGGLSDIVDHKQNGYLAKPFSVVDLSEGIRWVLSRDPQEGQALRDSAREKANRLLSPDSVVSKHLLVYERAIRRK